MVAGCVNQQQSIPADGKLSYSELTKLNNSLVRESAKINRVSQKHYGFNTLNNMYATKEGTIVMDMNLKAFNYSTLSINKQIEVMVDHLRTDKHELKRVGLYSITLLIDGEFKGVYQM
jgi:hypothetical protein